MSATARIPAPLGVVDHGSVEFLERFAQQCEEIGMHGTSIVVAAAARRIRALEEKLGIRVGETRVSPTPAGALGGQCTLVLALGGEDGKRTVQGAMEAHAASAGVAPAELWGMRLVDYAAKAGGGR